LVLREKGGGLTWRRWPREGDGAGDAANRAQLLVVDVAEEV
jgi:hypothetical protein